MTKSNQWSSKTGFILAATGSAVGLGNLWKFPYLMGKNGGFFFLLAYLVILFALGLPLMIAEISLGRKTGKNPVYAWAEVHPRAKIVGILGVLATFLVLSYYGVVSGWILKYFFNYLTSLQPPADFDAFISQPGEPLAWQLLFVGLTAFICLFGIRGIERTSKVMMPALFVLLVVILVRSLTLPGGGEGIAFIFLPQGSSFQLSSVSAALGQAFYSLSLCMGVMVAYGSYLDRKTNIPASSLAVAGLDTFIAMLAGMAVFPAVFSFGLEPGQGPGLIFGTLPAVFSSFGGGGLFGMLFFLLLFFAAVTSAIAMLEVAAFFVMEQWGLRRRTAVLLSALASFLLGIPCSLSFGPWTGGTLFGHTFYDWVVLLVDNLLLPVGGLLLCCFIGWRWKPRLLVQEVEREGVRFRWSGLWVFCIRILAPLLILIVTVSGFVSIYQMIAGG